MKLFSRKLPVLLACLLTIYGCSTTNSVPADEAAEAWYNLGNAYTELGRHDDAVKAFLKARRLNPELISAGFNLARVQILQSKYDDSLVQLEQLLEVDPGNRMLLETKAWVYHLKDDDSKALEIYEEVLLEFTDSRNSLHNSAFILVELKEYEKALVRFKRLVELYEDEDAAILEVAKLEAELGNNSDSILWVERYLSKYGENPEALELAGDMYALEQRYADAVTSYRLIYEAAGESGSPPDSNSQSLTSEARGRVYFKAAEILLVHIEDIEGGISALQASVDSGWKEQKDWDRLLTYSDAEWFEAMSGILKEEEVSSTAEEPAAEEL